MSQPRFLSGTDREFCVIGDCLMFFSLGLHVESSPVYRHFSSYALVKCRQLESRIRAVMLCEVNFPHLGFINAGVAPLPPRFRKVLDETV